MSRTVNKYIWDGHESFVRPVKAFNCAPIATDERFVELGGVIEEVVMPEPEPTASDYDRAMETYLKEVQDARGYTDRDPVLYAMSTNARWRQDAVDWSDFRDRVMEYGLQVMNQYASTGVIPCTLSEFAEHLRTITCNWTYNDNQSNQSNQSNQNGDNGGQPQPQQQPQQQEENA